MHLNGLSQLIFPPPASLATPLAVPAQQAPAATRNAVETDTQSKGRREAPEVVLAPGVIYTPGAAATEGAGGASQADIAALSLEQLITLGKSKGVFTQITYSKGSAFSGTQGGVKMDTGMQFVDSAVNIMRDFQAGMAALHSENPQAPVSKAHFWDAGLQGIKQAVGRFSAHV